MGRASRAKRKRPSWARRPEAATEVERLARFEWRIEDEFPKIWERLDFLRNEVLVHHLAEWPSWCYFPSVAVQGATSSDESWSRWATAVYAWRQGRSIYRVEPHVAAALADTEMSDEIPAEMLLQLPEWGLYLTGIPTTPPITGAFAYLDWSLDVRRPQLWVVIYFGNGYDGAFMLPLFLDNPSLTASLHEALQLAQPPDYHDGDLRPDGTPMRVISATDTPGWPLASLGDETLLGLLRPVVAVLLYLCSADPDVVDPDRPSSRPRRATKAAAEPRVFELGYRIGTALRAAHVESARLGGHHQAPSAHLRRAHWHHYWVGPRTGDDDSGARRMELRWIAPVLVGGDSLQTVVRPLE